MASKRRIILSMKERLKVLDDLKKFNAVTVAKKYDVHPSTIWKIKKNALRVMEFVSKGKMQQTRRNFRRSLNVALEQKLYDWFVERRTLGSILSNAILKQKAIELKESMGVPSHFKFSRGWLDGFKKRYDIRLVKIHGDSASANKDATGKFHKNFVKLMKEDSSIVEDNIYNMVETVIFWKELSAKTLAERKVGPIKGYTRRRDRITMVLCTNATGTHKLTPLIINKHENPRALKHSKANLPVIFKSHSSAWMTKTLFLDWYQNYFKPSVQAHQLSCNRMPGKIILLLDNCRGHIVPPEILDNDDCKIMYLPTNITSLIQPIHQGIIAKLKVSYREKTAQKAITYEGGINEFNKQFTLKDCIQLLHHCWMEVTALDIQRSWEIVIPKQTAYRETIMNTRLNVSTLTDTLHMENNIEQCLSTLHREETLPKLEERIFQANEEIQEDEEIEEDGEILRSENMEGNVEQEANKREEIKYLFLRLEQHMLQEPPFIKSMFKLFQRHYFGTDD